MKVDRSKLILECANVSRIGLRAKRHSTPTWPGQAAPPHSVLPAVHVNPRGRQTRRESTPIVFRWAPHNCTAERVRGKCRWWHGFKRLSCEPWVGPTAGATYNIQCTFRPFVFGVYALNFFYWEAPVVLESALVGPSPGWGTVEDRKIFPNTASACVC